MIDINVILDRIAGDKYRPFFAYDFNDASMEFPDNVSYEEMIRLYLLVLGITDNDCLEPCKTTFVQSSLRNYSSIPVDPLKTVTSSLFYL